MTARARLRTRRENNTYERQNNLSIRIRINYAGSELGEFIASDAKKRKKRKKYCYRNFIALHIFVVIAISITLRVRPIVSECVRIWQRYRALYDMRRPTTMAAFDFKLGGCSPGNSRKYYKTFYVEFSNNSEFVVGKSGGTTRYLLDNQRDDETIMGMARTGAKLMCDDVVVVVGARDSKKKKKQPLTTTDFDVAENNMRNDILFKTRWRAWAMSARRFEIEPIQSIRILFFNGNSCHGRRLMKGERYISKTIMLTRDSRSRRKTYVGQNSFIM